MNNKQFAVIIIWIALVSGLIGYSIGGVLMGILIFIFITMLFVTIGD